MPIQFDQLVLAGGGNRCWWQAGFWNALNEAIPQNPTKIVAVSAGAATACLFSARPGDEGARWGLNYYAKALASVSNNIDWKNLFSADPLFPHYRLYRAALENILGDGFERIQEGPEILIGLAKTPSYLSPTLSVVIGLLAYQLEKKLKRPLHPQSGKRLGFSRLFVSSKSCANIDELIETILQSSCTPPFTPVMYRDDQAILDGGLIDNVPIDGLTPAAPGEKNQEALILLTRRYGLANPFIQELSGLRLTYIQPSQKVPISSWDYSRHDLMPEAYELGKRDAKLAVTNGIFV
jgi:predicted acylesterase/phospholipase RssA